MIDLKMEGRTECPNPYMAYQNYEGHLKREELIDGGLYIIVARQAFVGLWSAEKNGFVIARNKFTSWYLFVEYHWDDEFCPTVKPLQMIGCILDEKEAGLLEFLMKLEKDNPLIEGWDSVNHREVSAEAYIARKTLKRKNRKVPIYKIIKDKI